MLFSKHMDVFHMFDALLAPRDNIRYFCHSKANDICSRNQLGFKGNCNASREF